MKRTIAVLIVLALTTLVFPSSGLAETGAGLSLQPLAGNYKVASSEYHPFGADGPWLDVTIQNTDPKNHRSVKFFDQGLSPGKIHTGMSVHVGVSNDGGYLIMDFYGQGKTPVYAKKRIAKVMMQVL